MTDYYAQISPMMTEKQALVMEPKGDEHFTNLTPDEQGSGRQPMCGYIAAALALVATLTFITYQDINKDGINEGSITSIVVSSVIVFVTTVLVIVFQPSVYAWFFCVDKANAPIQSPYWYWSFWTGFFPYFIIYTALFICSDKFIGKTGYKSRVDAHMIQAIVGANAAIGIIFCFTFGHAGGKQQNVYQDGKTNYIGIFSKFLVMGIWIFLFASQGLMFYVFSTFEDGPVRSLGQGIYWITMILVWFYLISGVFWLPDRKLTKNGAVSSPNDYQVGRTGQIRNILMTLLYGSVTWETIMLTIVASKPHPHLNQSFVYCGVGMQCIAYSFLVVSIITSIAKQAVVAGLQPNVFGAGDWMPGPLYRTPGGIAPAITGGGLGGNM